ncbi:RloB family protein [Neolewinella sp.]|uniref:RloB family protein n=1 Tax=Neolewinella sp. TaxID=2993543 RepID=UPI003B52F4B2
MGRRQLRAPKKVIAIVVDGQTEKWYLESLYKAERPTGVTIKPELPKKKTLPQFYAYAEQLARDADQVVLLLDMDAHLNDARRAGTEKETLQVFARKRRALERGNITFVVNHPCLERWFLLHFEASQKAYRKQKPLIDQLRSRHLSDYRKEETYYKHKDGSLYESLKDWLPKAIERSRAMKDFDIEQPDRAVCEMWRLFEVLGLYAK